MDTRANAVAPLVLAAACLLPSAVEAQTAPTYTRDVAPILFARCAQCHHPDGPAPFSVLDYRSVRQRATLIRSATASRRMPPWKAEPSVDHFVGQTPLTVDEIEIIDAWVAGGAVEGVPDDLPRPPAWTKGWQLGTPDLVVSAPAYMLPASGTDVFRIFVIDVPIDRTRYVKGFEFNPGNVRVAHHANIRLDATDTSRQLDEEDPASGYDGLLSRSAGYPEGYLLSWTPGQVPFHLPRGMAWRLEPGVDLVVELHMRPSGKVEPIQISVGLYFEDEPPTRIPTILRLGKQDIDIPAGEKHWAITDSFVLPVDVDVQSVQPHAHSRAKEIVGRATRPDGTVTPLIYIRDWDFTWQQVYQYAEPVPLRRGTIVTMQITYDNSDDNPRNQHPPRRVLWGQRSSDEMGDLWLQVLTKSDADRAALVGAFQPKMIAEDIVGYRMMLEQDPDSVPLHDDLALLLMDSDQPEGAVEQFGHSARLRPQSAAAQFNLGTALTFAGHIDEAIARYEAALAIKPEYSVAHNNLAGLLLQRGRIDDAMTHFSAAVHIDPGNAEAGDNLGRIYRELGNYEAALAAFRQAVRAKPAWPPAVADLAWMLATIPEETLRDPAEALRLAREVVTSTEGRDPGGLDVLAAAYAASGDFGDAVREAEAALELAPNETRQARLDLYRRGRPFRLPVKH